MMVVVPYAYSVLAYKQSAELYQSIHVKLLLHHSFPRGYCSERWVKDLPLNVRPDSISRWQTFFMTSSLDGTSRFLKKIRIPNRETAFHKENSCGAGHAS